MIFVDFLGWIMKLCYQIAGNYGVAIYSVLSLPDCYRLKISKKLWFECVDYNLTMPKIISSRYRKVD